jgi:hypothetical protein
VVGVDITPAMREKAWANALMELRNVEFKDGLAENLPLPDASAGALLVEENMAIVRKAGFENLRAGCMVDVFSGSAHESDAREFDTRGIVFSADEPWGAVPESL